MVKTKTKDLRAMSLDELEAKLLENKKEQFNLRVQQSTGQLQNTAQLAKVRKEVAKINTLITERKKNN
ncbi:MAG: 50S ribosomal protein L29 [Alphaproteobacteria bacterium]|nr:50S ribosomal protein L29 [Alphaproteobacteria bacterium]